MDHTIYSADGVVIDGETQPAMTERVKSRCISIVRLAVEPQHQRVEFYFRVRETQASRAEQRYAVVNVHPWETPVESAIKTVYQWAETNSYEIVTDPDSMATFNTIAEPDTATVPGSNTMVCACRDLLNDLREHSVTVPTSKAAVGLLSTLGGGEQSIAIADRDSDTGVENVELTIQIGDGPTDITPAVGTVSAWNQLANQYPSLPAVENHNDANESASTGEDGGFLSKFKR